MEHYLYENFSDLSASYEYSRLCCDDKCKAKAHAWRIPEKTLFGLSLLGGSAGTWAGMYAFRHKTKHWYFVKGMPLIFFIHVVIACVIYRNFY